MGTANEGDSNLAEGWRAEEAVTGNCKALEALRELVAYPFLYARESHLLSLKWPRGLLLYGPPGNSYSVHKVHTGEGEKFLREAFSEAYSQAAHLIDELDAI